MATDYRSSNDGLRRQLTLTWILMALIAAVFVLPTLRSWFRVGIRGTPRAVTPRGDLASFEKTTVNLFSEVSPSVVYVNVRSQVAVPFNRRGVEVEAGTGSGVVWDDAGHVVTNYHVIQEATSARVVMYDATSYDATLVGVSPDHDLAVLKINANAAQIRPVNIGTSHDLSVGQSVFAIGNPFGLNQTLTTGIVSAKSRTIAGPSGRPIEEVIQIDAAINPGNSGGPLLDSAGRLIGINTAIYSPSGASAGVGFAVPVDTVNRVVPQIIERGQFSPPKLGVIVHTELSQLVTKRLGIRGLLVAAVQPGSGAEQAGLKGTEIGQSRVAVLGDIIQEVNGRSISTMNDLALALDPRSPGEAVEVKLLRNGEVQTIQVVLMK